MSQKNIAIEPIGRIHSCYPEKFGIPKQPGLVAAATAWLELYPGFDRQEMAGGLAEFSHIWLLFIFHQTVAEGWKATVRPPRLGGRQRVGVYASRSPHRPNHIGMSVVVLEKVVTHQERVRLELSGVDLLDGTPVLDIKPYIPYADSLPDAAAGFTGTDIPEIEVSMTASVESFCTSYRQQTGRRLKELIIQTLHNDPRPASQREAGREFGVLLWDVNVRWRASENGFQVTSCTTVSGSDDSHPTLT